MKKNILNKIQHYLLLNHPLIWNIRLVPMLLLGIGINLLLFCIGYITTKNYFGGYPSYSSIGEEAIPTLLAILISALLFIAWLVYFNKNNAFKSFYPKSVGSLYKEWCLTFVIILGLALFPISFKLGSVMKLRTYASEGEMIEALRVLDMVDILIPQTKDSYNRENLMEDDESRVENLRKSTGHFLNDSISVQEQPDDVSADYSLLNYRGNLYYIPNYYISETVDTNKIILHWLKNEDKEKISELMDQFLALQRKHGLKTNLTKQEWMKLVYNPPTYPVGDFNIIKTFERNYDGRINNRYLQYQVLVSAYLKIYAAYNQNELDNHLLLAIYMSLTISLMVLATRSTSGRSFITALIMAGFIIVIFSILAMIAKAADFINDGSFLFFFLFLIVFIIELCILFVSVRKKGSKRKSAIIVNHILWTIPLILLLVFELIYQIVSDSPDHAMYIFQPVYYKINVGVTFLLVFFLIKYVLIRWKGLPEE